MKKEKKIYKMSEIFDSVYTSGLLSFNALDIIGLSYLENTKASFS